jgi:hypothetical protein
VRSSADDHVSDGLTAATAVAERVGLSVRQPVVLHSSNNLVVWLRPSPVIVKLGVGHYDRLDDELKIGAQLAIEGAPVVGPVEWDLAHLDAEVAAAYPHPHNPQRLARCRTIVSAQTAVWCWLGADRHPELRWHADHHLSAVKRALR